MPILTPALLVTCSVASSIRNSGALKPPGFAPSRILFDTGAPLLARGEGASASRVGAIAVAPVPAYGGFDRHQDAEQKKDGVENALGRFKKKDPKKDEKE